MAVRGRRVGRQQVCYLPCYSLVRDQPLDLLLVGACSLHPAYACDALP